MVKVIFIIIVVFGYPLATHENKISCKSTIYRILLVLEAGLEPAQPQWPRDFKSLVSTDSTIRAALKERKTRLELATLTLARLCSTN